MKPFRWRHKDISPFHEAELWCDHYCVAIVGRLVPSSRHRWIVYRCPGLGIHESGAGTSESFSEAKEAARAAIDGELKKARKTG